MKPYNVRYIGSTDNSHSPCVKSGPRDFLNMKSNHLWKPGIGQWKFFAHSFESANNPKPVNHRVLFDTPRSCYN